MTGRFVDALPELVFENPGMTAAEYAKLALDKRIFESEARDPVGSLETTLDQQYRKGNLQEVSRQAGRGTARFYPRSTFSTVDLSVGIKVTIRETAEAMELHLRPEQGKGFSEALLIASHSLLATSLSKPDEMWQLRNDITDLIDYLTPRVEKRHLE